VVTSQVFSRARINGSLRWQNPDCRLDGRVYPSRSFELSARSDVQCETSRCHVEKCQFSASDVFDEAHDEVCLASERGELH
jgi:hypothetical protein